MHNQNRQRHCKNGGERLRPFLSQAEIILISNLNLYIFLSLEQTQLQPEILETQIPTEKPQHEPDPSLASSSHGKDGICSGTSRVECSKGQSLNLGRELQELREKIELLDTKVNMQIKSLHTSEESTEIQKLLRMNEKQQERITALEQERNSLLALRSMLTQILLSKILSLAKALWTVVNSHLSTLMRIL